jgi:predicted Rdx family selenoprotein
LAAKIKKAHPSARIDLIKGSRGAFVVTVDGTEMWNKHEMGDEFPDEDRLVATMKEAG